MSRDLGLNLNLNDYDMGEILTLFKIKSYNITHEMVKDAKKIVASTHPDKSGLPSEYFIFFQKAFNVLVKIKEFQNKESDPNKISKLRAETDSIDSKSKQKIVNQISQQGDEGFNTWFNEQYELHHGKNTLYNKGDGYEEWLTSNDNVADNQNVKSVRDMSRHMDEHRQNIRAIVPQNEIVGISVNSEGYCDLEEECGATNHGSYCSTNTSNNGLVYTDLKQSQVECVIPVTQDDYNMPKFSDVNSYREHRNRQDIVPLTKEQSEQQFSNQNNTNDARAAHMMYRFAKQSEEHEKNNGRVWESLQRLT
jgi:hypothetical protein